MDKDNHTTSDNVQAFLNANIEKFAEYAKPGNPR